MTPELSVVIPTYNRADVLPRVLAALDDQTVGCAFEVIVVDDGGADATPAVLERLRLRYRLRAFRQENSGPAVARNRGVREAAAPLVVFLGDDTVPASNFLEEHRAAHARRRGRRVAVLGYTTWPPSYAVTPFLHYINEFGFQFGYSLIQDAENVPFNFFYTSNISLARSLLLEAGLFDESFPYAAWEDIELSYRLSRRGMRIVYCPGAVTHHYHAMTFESFRLRQQRSGEAAAIFFRKHPELGEFLGVPRALALKTKASVWDGMVGAWACLAARRRLPGGTRTIRRVLLREYLVGLRRGLQRTS